jgi:hypothetical protein
MLNKALLTRRKLNPVKIARFLAIVWVILSLADASITYVCLENTNNIEGNPFARALLSQNEALFYGAKFVVTIGIGLGFWWLATRTTYLKAMISCQMLLVVMFAIVLGNNMLHL